MVDNTNPTSQFHPYQREMSVPVAERPLSGLDSVLDRVGIDPTSVHSVRDQMKNLKLNQSFAKVRAYARANPGKMLSGLAALAIGIKAARMSAGIIMAPRTRVHVLHRRRSVVLRIRTHLRCGRV